MRTSVRSSSNPRIGSARSLHSRRGVLKRGLFLIEGSRFVSDYLHAGRPEYLLLAEGSGRLAKETAEAAECLGIDILEVPEKLFREISNTQNSQGVAAVAPLPQTDPDALSREGLILLLDGMRDPGNMGAVIRSAAAFGCSAVLAGIGSCFPYIPKVTRAAAAANTLVPVAYDVDLPEFIRKSLDGMIFVGACPDGGCMENLHVRCECMGLVIGSEAAGISPGTAQLLDRTVTLPMAHGIESLNAAVSASILLYEAGKDLPASRTEKLSVSGDDDARRLRPPRK